MTGLQDEVTAGPKASALPPPHPSMPPRLVTFIRRLWTTRYNETRYSLGRVDFDRLESECLGRIISSETLAHLAKRAYLTPDGPPIIRALIQRASSVYSSWIAQDKRTWGDKRAFVELFLETLKNIETILNIETSVANIEFKPSVLSKKARSAEGRRRLLVELDDINGRKPSAASPYILKERFNRTFEQLITHENRTTQITPGNLLHGLMTDPIPLDTFDLDEAHVRGVDRVSFKVSIYDLHFIVRQFLKAADPYIVKLRREHEALGNLGVGNGPLRHAVRELDDAVKPYELKFRTRSVKFGRDTAIAVFLSLLYGDQLHPETITPKSVHAWRTARRVSPQSGRNPKISPTAGKTAGYRGKV